MGTTLCANHYPIYIYYAEVHVSLCNYMNENFESAGEWTLTVGWGGGGGGGGEMGVTREDP